MPFKASADRRHKFPKAKYQVTNWPDYDAALIRRGSLTVWLTDEAIAGWHAPVSGKRGRFVRCQLEISVPAPRVAEAGHAPVVIARSGATKQSPSVDG
jgi:hypothetical protein